ncbi:MAG: type II toxin-antitoxin system VapC family toxin [Planctomycetota bacterium]
MTVYIETSVVSYYVSRPSRDLIVAAHQQITHEWWRKALPRCEPYVSPSVLDEIAQGDSEGAQRRLEVVSGMQVLDVTAEVEELAEVYASALGLPPGAQADAFHLAAAAWHGMEVLLTWNCRHIAATRTRRVLKEVNSERGISTPDICTPEECMEF